MRWTLGFAGRASPPQPTEGNEVERRLGRALPGATIAEAAPDFFAKCKVVGAVAGARLDQPRNALMLRFLGPVAPPISIAALVLLITGWLHTVGGAPSVLMHLYYMPVLIAGAKYGKAAAAGVGIWCGLVAGPWMPSAVGAGQQRPAEWLLRMAVLVMVGVVAAWLAQQPAVPVEQSVRDAVEWRALNAALRHDAITVHYQPLVSLASGRVLGAEALCRWFDRAGKQTSPAKFIPMAERTGLIARLGRKVAARAAAQASGWARFRNVPLTMSINVSAKELSDDAYLDTLTHVVGGCATEKVQLCLEITETALMANPERARATLQAARAMGVLIAIDDFGTGQSSLAYLAQFPVDIIKIDASFVSRVEEDEFSQAVVTSVVQLAASLGAQTVAEGIETPGQLSAVRELGCDIGQGYYLGRPASGEAFDWEPRQLNSI